MTQLDEFPEGIREHIESIMRQEPFCSPQGVCKKLDYTLPSMIQWIWNNVNEPVEPGPHRLQREPSTKSAADKSVVVIGHSLPTECVYLDENWETHHCHPDELYPVADWPEWFPFTGRAS